MLSGTRKTSYGRYVLAVSYLFTLLKVHAVVRRWKKLSRPGTILRWRSPHMLKNGSSEHSKTRKRNIDLAMSDEMNKISSTGLSQAGKSDITT